MMFEYEGPYGCRYTCRDCKHRTIGSDYQPCSKQGVEVLGNNNVCRSFDPRIINPSSPKFNFNEYLEYLGSDFYRPWGITDEVIGSAKLGEAIADGGKLARLLPKVYSPWYQSYDKPYCRVFMPRCHVEYNGRKFEIDYRIYRELRTVKNGEIEYTLMLWKDKPTQRKYYKEINGRWHPSETK